MCVCVYQIVQMDDEFRTGDSRFARLLPSLFVCFARWRLATLLCWCVCFQSFFLSVNLTFSFSILSMPLNRVIVPTVGQAAVCVCARICCCREQTAVRCVWTEKEHRGPVHPVGCETQWLGPPVSPSVRLSVFICFWQRFNTFNPLCPLFSTVFLLLFLW